MDDHDSEPELLLPEPVLDLPNDDQLLPPTEDAVETINADSPTSMDSMPAPRLRRSSSTRRGTTFAFFSFRERFTGHRLTLLL